jgi:hypothetical protein
LRARALLMLACRRWLEQRGALDAVLRRVTPETRALLENPPVRTSWLPCEVFEDAYQAIAGLHGIEAVREMGHEATRDSLAGTVLKPFIQAMSVMGSTPASFFSHLNLSIRASMRGVTTEYRPTGETSGVVVARYAAPLPPMVQQASLGSLRYVFELARVTGTTTLLGVEDERRLARIGVSWQARAAPQKSP